MKGSLISIIFILFLTVGRDAYGKGKKSVTFRYTETTEAFPNPLKGFRGGEYATLNHVYIKWSDIEKDSTDGVEKIKEYSEIC